MIATLLGFLIRYVPNLFSWIGTFWEKKEDFKREKEMLVLQMQLEEKKAELAIKGLVIQAQITEALAGLQADISMVLQSMRDRASAREYGVRLLSIMDQTLMRGKELGVPQLVLSGGWIMVILIEALSASIQPGLVIATIGLLGWHPEGAKVIPMVLADLAYAVIGFYLAGRVQKYTESKRVSTATGR